MPAAELDRIYGDGYRALEGEDLEAAEIAARDGLRRARDAEDPTWVRAFQVLEAEILVAQRRIEEALVRLDAGPMRGRFADAVRARALMTRGYAHCFLPDSPAARNRSSSDLEAAAATAAALGADRIVAEVTIRLGTCLFRRDELDRAEREFRRAMAMARRLGLALIEAQAAGSLGRVRVRGARFDDAARWLRRSLELVADQAADGIRLKTFGNLGWCYVLLGDYERAIQVLTEADDLARRRGYAGDRVPILYNLGQALRGQGDAAGAHRAYVRAAAVAHEIRDRHVAAELLGEIHATRATLALERGHLGDAASQVEAALRIQTRLGDPALRRRSLLLEGEIWQRRGNLARAARRYQAVIESPDVSPELLWEAHAASARLHVRAGRPVAAEQELQSALELMEIALARPLEVEHRLPLVANSSRFYDQYVDFLVAEGRVLEALRMADRSRARLIRERLLDAGSTAAEVIDYPRLGRDLDSLLLFYWTAVERSYLWIITPDNVKWVALPDEGALETLVASYQRLILDSRDPIGEVSAEARELYRLLIQPASAALAAAERVVIVTDGPLHHLNFETLVTPGADPHFLIEDATIVRTPSLELLSARASPAPRRPPSLLVLGDPVSPGDEFPRLASAGREVAAIAELFAGLSRSVYTGRRANPTAYLNAELERFRYIHFAAHAETNSVVPLDSAIVLSARGEDYKLYARDILTAPLNAELVTLSACRSAGGRAFAGEGLVGLSWAFLSAGARNVIGGLWPVEDASTAELMTRLYRELVAGAAPALALRRAKLQLLRSDTAYRKPYYWAPFVTYTAGAGDPSPMRSTAQTGVPRMASSSPRRAAS